MPLITNIQKFSIHDGDGVRTTVFFKGCPLKCQWCHNPETQRFNLELMLDEKKCVGCGMCEQVCPEHAIKMIDTKQATEEEKCVPSRMPVTDMNKCSGCGKCEDFCTGTGRELVGKEYSIKKLVKLLLKDRMFYEESGGGVTLSGGEVMSEDIEYVNELCKALHKEDITVTIDTCGYAPYEKFEAILPYIDTFLYDVKVMDPELHQKYIGVPNDLILENLCKLSQAGARIYIRIPTIKEVSGTDDNMQQTIDFLKANNINVANVNLLPYHNTGSSKYSKIGREYDGDELHAPTDEEMQHFQDMFKQAGYKVKIGG